MRYDRTRNFSHAARCVTRSGRHLFFSRGAKTNGRFAMRLDTRLTSRGLRYVPQVVLIFDVLFLFCLKAIALQHRINRRRCHYYPFDRHKDIDCERASDGARVWWSRKVDHIAIRFRFDCRRMNRARDYQVRVRNCGHAVRILIHRRDNIMVHFH